MQFPSTTLFFLLYLFGLNLLEIEARKQFGENTTSLFEVETNGWKIKNSKFEDIKSKTKIDNSTQPKLALLVDNTTQIFILRASYWVPAPHKYVVGSAKLWYSDDDFSDESTLTLEVFIHSLPPKTMEDLEREKPCFMMNISSPKEQNQPNFEYIYFGESQNRSNLFLIMKVSIHSHGGQLAKPKLLALRDVTLHLSNESQAVTYSRSKCPLGQALDENLTCQDCAENCGSCFGTKASQCLSCSAGSHWHGSGCIKCHGNCENCTGPTQHECSSCNFGFCNYGNGTCLDQCYWPFQLLPGGLCEKICKSDEYAFRFNYTCRPSCTTPFVPSTDNNGLLICNFPCLSWRDFLYMNGSCNTVCPAPFITEISSAGYKLCKYPCRSTSDYVYSNRSCLKECKAPFKIRSEPMVNYCVNPCDSENLYIYNNSSCLSSCPPPLVEVLQSGAKYCRNPCQILSAYLYANRSCLKECPAPLKVRSEPAANFCFNPCDSENLYLYNNGSCLSSCPTPLVEVLQSGVTYCRNPCLLETNYLFYNQSCFTKCPFPLQIRTEPVANFCLNPCQSEHLYLDEKNGSCFSVCKTPLVAVMEYGIRYCRNPCKSESEYLYTNRSCLKECPAPLMAKSDSRANYCVNPCAKSNLYLSNNGSCLSTCAFPRKIKEESGVKYCEPPCNLNGEYILRDGSCSKECPVPLIQKIEMSVGTFCLTPCQSNDHFILRNRSCGEECPSYFDIKRKYGVKYCIPPCLDDQYYFPKNKSCLDKCSNPLKITHEEGINLCQNPCSNSNYFIYDDKSCHKSCPVPLRIEEKIYCKSPCLTEYVNSDGECQESCEYPDRIIEIGRYKICQIGLKKTQSAQIVAMKEIIRISNFVSEIGGVLSCLMSGGDATSLLMVPLLGLFQKIFEIDIVMPEKTEFILNQATTEFSRSDERDMMMAIFSLIALLIPGLLKLRGSSNESKLYQLIVKLDVALRWNTLIPLFICMSNEFELESPKDILYILLIIFVIWKIFNVSQRGREEENPRWRFLFENFSENQRFFILIYFVRVILCNLTVGLLENSPRFQAFSMILLSFGMCFCLVWGSPIQKTLSKIQYLIVEFALLMYNMIFCVLAVFDLSDGLVADIFGQLMNILYLITSIITAVIIVVKILQNIYKIYSSSRTFQANQMQMSEINQDSPPENIHFEALNEEEEEVSSADQNNFDSEGDSIEPSIAIE